MNFEAQHFRLVVTLEELIYRSVKGIAGGKTTVGTMFKSKDDEVVIPQQ
jgi:hypothetical protein